MTRKCQASGQTKVAPLILGSSLCRLHHITALPPPAGRQPGVECFRAQPPSSPPPPPLEEAQQRTRTRLVPSLNLSLPCHRENILMHNSAPSRYMSLSLSHPGCRLQTDMNDMTDGGPARAQAHLSFACILHPSVCLF